MSKPSLRLVLGDQLTFDVAALVDLDPARDTVLMAEVQAEATYVRHHRKKLVLVFSAMRHFAQALRAQGIEVRYVELDDPRNTHAIGTEVARAAGELGLSRVVATQCGEWRLDEDMRRWAERHGLEVDIREDTRFLCPRDEFARWAQGRKALRMEFFYREMRRRHAILMDGNEPAGGQWNFDHDNRAGLDHSRAVPARPQVVLDTIDEAVIALVEQRFPDHFGDLRPFGFATTHTGAEALARHFFDEVLAGFGEQQDAMDADEPFMWHALVSMYLNLGLLDPLDLCRQAEAAWREGRVPLNAAEGFIRQILGWREYVRGIYWLHMPEYALANTLGANRDLPDFYWSGETDMACIADAVRRTRENAYAHHIQRLMVTGNFALLAGIDPAQVNEWYLIVYADAYEWVELPNTHGMALFADGGIMASKPYAASGRYIDRMSNYCGRCRFDPGETLGETACPFNALYWDFLDRNRGVLGRNPRLAMPYRTLDRFDPDRVAAMRAQAQGFLATLVASDGHWTGRGK
jgi:deoxyribodipyrimidine photolyase-related protein